MRISGLVRVAAACTALAALAACDSEELNYPVQRNASNRAPEEYTGDAPKTGLFGQGGLNIFGGAKPQDQAGGGAGIGVNAYLWRATLDTISFLPLSSADPFGGVIITDWYQPPETPNERFKLSVFILDRQLRADGIRVSVFHQVKDASGNWADAPVDAKTAANMENAILTRARQLRIAATAAKS